MTNLFSTLALRASRIAGHYLAFGAAIAIIVIWLLAGPLFGFSDTWQLLINTSTTIVTFLMVFLIQNGQNRDMRAMHLKLDELIRAIDSANDDLIDAEDVLESDLNALQRKYALLAHQHRALKRSIEGSSQETDDS